MLEGIRPAPYRQNGEDIPGLPAQQVSSHLQLRALSGTPSQPRWAHIQGKRAAHYPI